MVKDSWPRIGKKFRFEMLERGLHWCRTCKEFLPTSQFETSDSGLTGYAYVCNGCYSSLKDKWIPKSKGQRDWQSVEYWRSRRKALFIEMTGNACQRCGYNEFLAALSFHHIEKKSDKISAVIQKMSLKRALEELDKCILLCVCCHSAYHANEWGAEFIKRDGLGWTIKQFRLINCT